MYINAVLMINYCENNKKVLIYSEYTCKQFLHKLPHKIGFDGCALLLSEVHKKNYAHLLSEGQTSKQI